MLSFFSQFTDFSKKDFPKVAGSFQHDKAKEGDIFVAVSSVLPFPHFKDLRPHGNPLECSWPVWTVINKIQIKSIVPLTSLGS